MKLVRVAVSERWRRSAGDRAWYWLTKAWMRARACACMVIPLHHRGLGIAVYRYA